MPRFLKPLILALVAVALIGATAAGPAEARLQTKCSADLIHDWYVDGRIDKTYQVHCYREALRDIPEDQVVYGTLREDLTRALQAVIRSDDGDVTGSTPVPGAGGGGDGDSGDDGGLFGRLAKAIGPDTADSIPVPLLVLGGLALLLMAAAAVSFFARRLQARKAGADPPPAGPTV